MWDLYVISCGKDTALTTDTQLYNCNLSSFFLLITMQRSFIHNNFAQDTAGGVFLNGSSPTFENVTVADNDASYARGIYCRSRSLLFEN